MEKINFTIAVVLLGFISNQALAEGETTTLPPTPTTTAATPAAQQFELIEGAAQIAGEPDVLAVPAQKKWQKACDDWKQEFKELNKSNQIIALSCNSPSCQPIETASTICTSNATYKIKTAGVLVRPPTPPPAPEPPKVVLPPDQMISMAPPQPIVEVVPPVRVGYVWIGGYWGWQGQRYIWFPGRWAGARPGFMWYPDNWYHHGRGWYFHQGYWGKIH